MCCLIDASNFCNKVSYSVAALLSSFNSRLYSFTFESTFRDIITSNVDLIYSIISNNGSVIRFSVSLIKSSSVNDFTYN